MGRQATVRRTFSDCTILTIAHRISTVIDYDRILVMDAGRVAEYGSPHELLCTPGSEFGALVDGTGPESAAVLRHAAETASRRHRVRDSRSGGTASMSLPAEAITSAVAPEVKTSAPTDRNVM